VLQLGPGRLWSALLVSYNDVTDDVVPLAKVDSCKITLNDPESSFGEVKDGMIEVTGPFARTDRQVVKDMLRR